MAIPSKLLQPDEQVVIDLRPHWWHLAAPGGLLIVAIVAGLASLATTIAALRIVAGIAILIALVNFGFRYARWSTTNFAITTERVIYRQGLVARRGTEMPLEKVNTVDFRQSVFERIIGAGDLVIESGSDRGVTTFSDVRKPQLVQQELNRLMDAKEKRNYVQPLAATPAPASIPEQIAQLARLRDEGVLTDVEFQNKKSDLLGRL